MVKIRLAKHGKKGKPIYRIVAVDEKKKREGSSLEVIGLWNPLKKTLKIDKERLTYWLTKGAVKTKAVDKLLTK